MGASASTIHLSAIKLTEKECKHALKELFDKKMFDAFVDPDNLISLEALQTAFLDKTDVFLTHDWGTDEGVDNHKRVGAVNEALKKRGLKTWFDAEKMEGNVKKKMISGIESTYCVVVFVTKRYMDKVNCDNAEDNCQLEFNYASRRKTGRKMVPVVMEARMRDTSEWIGEVGMVLGGSLYVDLSSEDSFEARMDDIYSRALGVTGTTIQKVMEDKVWRELIESKMHSAAPASAPAPASSPLHKVPAGSTDQARVLDDLETEMLNYITAHTKIARKFTTKYVLTLSDAGIGSIEKLVKKLTRNPNYLLDVGIDEDDVEELVFAVMSNLQKAPEAVAIVTAAPNVSDRDFADILQYYYHSRILSKDGKEQLLVFARDESDKPRCMLAKGMLAICFARGGGKFTPADETKGKEYSASCFAYLKEFAYQPSEDIVSPSDIVQKPTSFGALAAWALGSIMKDGLGVVKDEGLGYKFIEVAALQGLMIAYNTMGVMFMYGSGVEKNVDKAVQYYRLGLEKNFAISQHNLAMFYRLGQHVQIDVNEAMRLHNLAAAQGYPESMFRLGIILYNGDHGVARDIATGTKWLKEAAAKGSQDAIDVLDQVA